MRKTTNPIARREFLSRLGGGLGGMALSSLLGQELYAVHGDSASDGFNLQVKPNHFPARAKAVIQLVQTGGPPQMDLFDRKPELQKRDGQVYEITMDPFQKGSERNKLIACPFPFRHYGESGMEMSTLIPKLGAIADDLCLVRSAVSLHNNHPEATSVLATGKIFSNRPSLGTWISYALGTENENLPAFVVIRDPDGYSTGGTLMSQSGWLPALYGGTEFSSRGPAVHNLHAPDTILPQQRKRMLTYLAQLNERHRERFPIDSDLETRIRNYELAARMQLNATKVLDLSNETQETLSLYGIDDPSIWKLSELGNDDKYVPGCYATGCLMARRLVEAGVRFVQVFVGKGQPWDLHWKLKQNLPKMCRINDRTSAALLVDLKRRGLLDDTIVLWSGEFGRLPVAQEGGSAHQPGRDHNKRARSLWLSGGGFKGGVTYGTTDEVGYETVDKKVTTPDLFATIAHQMGLDHEGVSFPHAGRQETMSDAETTGAHVLQELIG